MKTGTMKHLALLTLTLSLSANPAAQSKQSAPGRTASILTEQQIARKALASLVYVSADSTTKQPGRTAYGTGFFIEGGFIITCYHVVVDAESLRVGPVSSGRSHGAILFGSGDDNDLAILRSQDGFKLPALALAPKLPAIGERVYVASNPRGYMGSFTAGNVSGYRKLESGGLLMQISAPISPGSSGGAVLNTKAEVVGVVSASRADAQNLNFAVPVSEVRAVLLAARDKEIDPYAKILADIRSQSDTAGCDPPTAPRPVDGWRIIGTSQTETRWYHPDCLRKLLEGEVLIAGIKSTLLNNTAEVRRRYQLESLFLGLPISGFEHYSHTFESWEADCANVRVRLLGLDQYDSKGKAAASTPWNEWATWREIHDGSITKAIWSAVCLEGSKRVRK